MKAVITGGSSGIGREIIRQCYTTQFFNLDVKEPDSPRPNEVWLYCDVSDPDSIFEVNQDLPRDVKFLINSAGVNHIAFLEDQTVMAWDALLNVNARSIFLTTQMLRDRLAEQRGIVINIVSNAWHDPFTASLPYNASKGAAHIMTLQLAHELSKKDGIAVLAVSPARIAGTAMTKYVDDYVVNVRGMTLEEAQEHQKQRLVGGEYIPLEALGKFMKHLIENPDMTWYLTGCDIPFGA